MVLNSVLLALRSNLQSSAPELESSPSLSTISQKFLKSGRRARLFTRKRHVLRDPRCPLPALYGDASWKAPPLNGKIITFDLTAPSNPVRNNFDGRDLSLPNKENEVFFVHKDLVRSTSVVFDRHLTCNHSIIRLPAQDRDVVQLFVRFLYSGNINSNVPDACSVRPRSKLLTFKLGNNSTTHLMTPDAEETLLVKAYLFGHAYSCWTFCDAIIDTLIVKIIDGKRTPVLHSLVDLSTNCGSFYPLKILIAHLALFTWSEDQLCGFALAHKFDRMDHVRFWADVGDYSAVWKLGTYGLPKAPWRESACHYHVHNSYPKMNYTCYTQGRQG